jgi:8-oxo-dGTP pyrophosphatase MutT (NUDIX family)
MASVGPSRYVVVVLHFGGSKLADVKLVLQREPRSGKTWFSAGSITPDEEHVDAAVRELHEETGLILTRDGLTLLTDAPARVALPLGQQLIYVYSASVPVPYVTTHLRTPAQLEHAVTAQSTINHDGSYVVPETVDIGGMSLTPAKKGLVPSLKQKNESLHFGYVTHFEIFRRAVYTSHVLCCDDPSVPRQFFMYFRFNAVDFGLVYMLVRGYIN